jgi:hypothetical protein
LRLFPSAVANREDLQPLWAFHLRRGVGMDVVCLDKMIYLKIVISVMKLKMEMEKLAIIEPKKH